MKWDLKALFIAPFLMYSSLAMAWSGSGHKIIAEIASQHISPSTKSKISTLMDGESMQKSAWWPDTIKGATAWKHTKGYHFEELDDGVNYFDSLKNASDYIKTKGDVIRALLRAEDVLRDSAETKANKQNALRFLLHLMGDIHQPLHAGYKKDVGGNTIKMDWFGSQRNLHSVWDGSLISSYAYENQLPKETMIESYSSHLSAPTANEISDWNKNYIYDWYMESVAVRNEAYLGVTSSSEVYYAMHIDLNNERLQQAGFRLANWLDQIFSGAPLSPQAKKLRADVSKILGADYRISLSEKTN